MDALGTYCPVPVKLLARVLGRVLPGDGVVLLADDPLIEVDLPAWCHKEGHDLDSLAHEDGAYRARVRRGAAARVVDGPRPAAGP